MKQWRCKMSIEIYADNFCELQDLLREEAIEEINWAFVESFEN